MKNLKCLLFMALAFVMASCDPTLDPVPEISKGVYVLNEGSFGYANSSLSFLDFDKDTIYNNVFQQVNQAPLGDVAQSICISDKAMYIVVNNSKYIYKVNKETIEFESKIENFYSPRFMHIVNDTKAYVTDLVGSGIWVINPTTMEHVKFIETGKSTEKMVQVANELFVVNWSSFYNNEGAENNTVQVINTDTDEMTAEITVTKEPNSIVVDKNDNIWVLCSGGYSGEETPALYCIDAASKQVKKNIEIQGYPQNLAIDNTGTTLYYINGGIYSMSITDTAPSNEAFVAVEGGQCLYNIAVDPENGDVFVTDAKDFQVDGELLRYSKTGTLLGRYTTGIIPRAMAFN